MSFIRGNKGKPDEFCLTWSGGIFAIFNTSVRILTCLSASSAGKISETGDLLAVIYWHSD